MKRAFKTGKYLLIFVCILLSLIGCSKGGSKSGDKPEDTIIPETTKVLDNSSMQKLVSISNSTVTFSETTPQLTSLKKDDVIVFNPSLLTPRGLLRKITTITKGARDQLVVETSQATLEDAINTGSTTFTKRLTSDDLDTFLSLNKGITLGKKYRERGFFLEIKDVVLYDDDEKPETTNDQVRANGSIDIDPDIEFDIKLENFEIKEFIFKTGFSEKINLEIEAKISKDLLQKILKIPGGTFKFKTFTIWIGWVPIFIGPEITLYVGIDGKISAGIKTSVSQETTLAAGIEYNGYSWNPISLCNASFTFAPPSPTVEILFQGYAKPELDIWIEGIVGPKVAIKGFLEAKADPFANPWWELYGGVQADIGIKVDVLGKSIVDQDHPAVIGYKKLLAKANQSPTITITSPYDGAIFTAPAAITINADATDPSRSVSKVEFYQGSTLLYTDTSSPYSYTWPDVSAGNYVLKAIATDDQGATGESAPINIIVNNPNSSPAVGITKPNHGENFTTPVNIEIKADATDPNRLVSKVDFYQGTTLLGTDNTEPYSYTWLDVPAGNYVLKAIAADDQGATGESAPISITVNTPNPSPTINITKPTTGQIFTALDNIPIEANASDSRYVAKVDFYANDNLLYQDNTAPYSYTWNTGVAGNYAIKAVATDNQGATGEAIVNIIVNAPPTVSITNPTDGQPFTAPVDIPIQANASDSDGSVAKVEFLINGLALHEDTSSPYSYLWQNAPTGSHILRARATDNNGAITTSSAVNITVADAPSIGVTPADNLISSGIQGGPFNPNSKQYTINAAGGSINWQVSNTANWITVNPPSGTATPSSPSTVTISINTQANTLAPGQYNYTINFVNTTNGQGNTTRQVNLTVTNVPTMSVSPTENFSSFGESGGPFNPTGKNYTINATNGDVDWEVGSNINWVTITPINGTATPATPSQVTITLNANANNLSEGENVGTITFTNKNNGQGNTTRSVTLMIVNQGWVQVIDSASWLPRASFSSLVYNDKIWILGGRKQNGQRVRLNDIWNSSDGVNWTQVTASAPWSARDSHASVVYDNKIWLVGGFSDSTEKNDVWNSSDGVNWTQVTASAPWSARYGHTLVVYNSKIWLLGGSQKHDVWNSSDGLNWTQVTSSASWSARYCHTSVVYNDKIWVIGGGFPGSNLTETDVWNSSDGVNWNLVNSSPAWVTRGFHTSVVYNNKIWLLGGTADGSVKNDVWTSGDGITWSQATASAPWSARFDHASVIYNSKIWLLAGSNSDPIEKNDVWYYTEPPQIKPIFAVANADSDNVTMIDATTNQVVATVPTGDFPYEIAFGNNRFAVANGYGNSVTIIDALTFQVLATVSLQSTPLGIAYGNNRFGVVDDSGTVTMIDATTHQKLASIPVQGSRIAFGNNRFAVTKGGSEGSVTMIDATTHGVLDTIYCPNAQNVVFGNNRFAVVKNNASTGGVAIIDATTHQILNTVSVGGIYQGKIAYGNNRFVVTSFNNNTVTIISASTNQILETIAVIESPENIAYGNNRFAVLIALTDIMTIIDANSHQILADISLGVLLPTGSTLAYGNARFAVTSKIGDTVSIVDAATNQVIATIPVGQDPIAIAFSN